MTCITNIYPTLSKYRIPPCLTRAPSQTRKINLSPPNYDPGQFPAIAAKPFRQTASSFAFAAAFRPYLAIETLAIKTSPSLFDEQTVCSYTWLAVETTVRDIVAKLLEQKKNIKANFEHLGGLKFDEHKNSLSNSIEEVQAKVARPDGTASIPVDQYSIVLRAIGGNNNNLQATIDETLFLIEYKTARKLTASIFRSVLGNGDFDINGFISRPTIPNDGEA